MKGDFAAALDDCAVAISIDKHFVPAFLIRGGVLIRTGEYAAALLEFNQAIRINPRYAKAFNDRGVAYSKLGKFEEAIRDFDRSIELVSGDAQALSNRGSAYHLMHQYQEALRDFTAAVVIDSKYSATYSLMRGMTEAGRGNLRQALADYAVALVIDPKSRAARLAQADAREKLDSDFEVTPTVPAEQPAPSAAAEASVPAPAADSEIVDLSDAVVEEESAESESAAVASTQHAMPARGAGQTHFALPAAQAAEQSAYEAEQQEFRNQERLARMRALAEKAEEIRLRNVAADAKKKVEVAKRKGKKAPRDPEQMAAQWRRYKQYAVFTLFSLVAAYYGGQLIWSLIPPSKNPYKEFAAEKLVEEYAKDPAAADEKFADHVIVVRGKLRIVRAQVRKGQVAPPPKIYFELPEQEKLVIECTFDDPDVIADMRTETEYRIAGRVQKYKAGTPITLKQATIKEGPGGQTTAREFKTLSLAAKRLPTHPAPTDVAAHANRDLAEFHALFARSLLCLQTGFVQTVSVHPRERGGILLWSPHLAWSYS